MKRNKWVLIIGNSIFLSIPLSLILWVLIVLKKFNVHHDYYQFYSHAIELAFKSPNLIWITYSSIIIAILFSLLGNYLYYFYLEPGASSHFFKNKKTLRGAKIIKSEELVKLTSQDVQIHPITLAGVPIPTHLEPLHFLIGGSTGSGKTFAMLEMLKQITKTTDKVIVTDPNGEYFSYFGKQNDILMNPFDQRSPGWSVFNEIQEEEDPVQLSKSIIPPASNPQDKEWHRYGQDLVAATLKKLLLNKEEATTQKLCEWLTIKPAEELKEFLKDTSAAGLFQPGASKALASTRFIISKYLSPYNEMNPGTFSLKSWLKSEEQSNLYLPWLENQSESLKPLISTWLDILCSSILSLPPNNERRVWLFIDELAALEYLNSLEPALTRGRKYGLRVVAGLQSTSQLDVIYERDKAKTLFSCFRTLLVLGGSSSDPDTAERFSQSLGEVEYQRSQIATTKTRQGTNRTETVQTVLGKLVLPVEIMKLEKLAGYLNFAGDYPVAKIAIQPEKFNVAMPAFLRRKKEEKVEASNKESIDKEKIETPKPGNLLNKLIKPSTPVPLESKEEIFTTSGDENA